MDIKEQINKVVETVTKDKNALETFKSNPVAFVEKVLGVDLPDDIINQVVKGVQGKISLDSASGLLNSVKGLFSK